MTPIWQLVSDGRPDAADFPVTVVRSQERDRAVWTPLLKVKPSESEEIRKSVAQFFEHGEYLTSEDWYPPLA